MYKVTGDTHAGGATCGHRVKRGEVYYIIRRGGDLLARCAKCIESKKRFKFKRVITVKAENVVQIGLTI